MEHREIELQYKGQRNYIQGPDLFNEMLDGYLEEEIRNIRFSVHGFINTPLCDLYCTNFKEELLSIEDVHAKCQFDLDGKTYFLALSPNCKKVINENRVEYDESAVLNACRVEDSKICLNAESPFSFIETVVSMNKKLLQNIFSDVEGKWVFTRIDLTKNSFENEKIELNFKHNMSFRLTKSDVLVNGEKIGDIYFSLVKS